VTDTVPARRDDTAVVVGADILAYLGLNPASVEAHALVAVCKRYGLDPVLNQAQVIATKKGARVYITRDGMLEIAHRSGQLDGIVVEEERQSENGYSATVSVWRKDMAHPFTYKGGCGAGEPQAETGNGAEMALARAERRALKRAFAIPADDDIDDPILDTGPLEHRMVETRNSKDPWYRCSCGEKFATQAEFHRHHTPAVDATPAAEPAGPGRKSRRDQPPVELYDSLPEARGLR
jgi:hypothetical protein